MTIRKIIAKESEQNYNINKLQNNSLGDQKYDNNN